MCAKLTTNNRWKVLNHLDLFHISIWIRACGRSQNQTFLNNQWCQLVTARTPYWHKRWHLTHINTQLWMFNWTLLCYLFYTSFIEAMLLSSDKAFTITATMLWLLLFPRLQQLPHFVTPTPLPKATTSSLKGQWMVICYSSMLERIEIGAFEVELQGFRLEILAIQLLLHATRKTWRDEKSRVGLSPC